MTSYILFSDGSPLSRHGEELAKKLGIESRLDFINHKYYNYPVLTSFRQTLISHFAIKELNRLNRKDYLLCWLLLEGRTSLVVAGLIAESY